MAAEKGHPQLLQHLLSCVPQIQLTATDWERIFMDLSYSVSAILYSASHNKNLLISATPNLFRTDGTVWQKIIEKEPQVIVHLAYTLSSGLITLDEREISGILANLTENDWLSILTLDNTLLYLTKAYKKGHKTLFDTAKGYFSKIPSHNWKNIIAHDNKIISRSISLDKRHEPALLSAIVKYTQALPQEDLEALLNDIRERIPKLAKYAIQNEHTELCQVLDRALQIRSIHLELTDHQQQQILALSRNDISTYGHANQRLGYTFPSGTSSSWVA